MTTRSQRTVKKSKAAKADGRRFAIGFVGGGNMATALINGFVNAGLYRPAQMCASDVDAAKRRALERRLRVTATADNESLIQRSQIVMLAVKPQIVDEVLAQCRSAVTRRHLFISILAGVPTSRLEAGLGPGARVVRAMPNTPALLGKGMTVVVRGSNATAADERTALRLFRAVGRAAAVRDEGLMHAVTGLSGSGPAYVYLFAEALITGGIAAGLAPELAAELTLQTISGAAAMLTETGESPQRLRAMVTSPGGTTLAGVTELERRELVAAVTAAVLAATRRGEELGKS